MAESIYFADGSHEVLFGDGYQAFGTILRERLGPDVERAFLKLTATMRSEIESYESSDMEAALDEALDDARDLSLKLHEAREKIDALEGDIVKVCRDRNAMLASLHDAGRKLLSAVREGVPGVPAELRDLAEDMALAQSYEEKEPEMPRLEDLHVIFDMDGVLNVFVEQDSVTKPFNVPGAHYFRDCRPDMSMRDLFLSLKAGGTDVVALSRIHISGADPASVNTLLAEQDGDKQEWCRKWLGPDSRYEGLLQTEDKNGFLQAIPRKKRRDWVLIDDDPDMLAAWEGIGGTGILYLQAGRETGKTWHGSVLDVAPGIEEAERLILSARMDGCAPAHAGNTEGEVTRMATLGTAHVTASTADMLDRDPETNELELSVYPKAASGENVGWFIYLPDGPVPEDWPRDLKDVAAYARARDCRMVCLDCDGPVLPDLPAYDWEGA